MFITVKLFAGIALIVVLLRIPTSHSARLLLIPITVDSHFLYFSIAADALTKKGHDVYILATPQHHWTEKLKKEKFQVITYEIKWPESAGSTNVSTTKDRYNLSVYLRNAPLSGIDLLRKSLSIVWPFCANLLEDEILFEQLKSMKFDLIMVDGIPASRCQMVLAYRLGIPFVTLSTYQEPWLTRTPALPSFIPFAPTGNYENEMNFVERMTNFWSQIDWHTWPNFIICDDAIVSTYVKERPVVSLNYLAGKSLIWFYNVDVLFDSPLPRLSNIIHVGGLTTKPANKLPNDLETFAEDAADGLIVVSFGTLFTTLPEDIEQILLEAFSKLSAGYRVVWRTNSKITTRSNKIRTLPWLPQNDLFGHNKTVLFITHCGSNGQFEALYHGIPMLGLPILTDQHYNARRMAYKGYGLYLQWKTLTANSLLNAINEVLENRMYKINIQKASHVYKSRKIHPKDMITYWIDHILKFGGEHLRSSALEMPSWTYLMLDVICLSACALFLFVFIIFCAIGILKHTFN